VDHSAGAGDDVVVEAVVELVRGSPEPGAPAELHGGDRYVQGVDQIRVREGADGLRSSAEPDVSAAGCCAGLIQDFGGGAVDEVERGAGQGRKA